VAAPTQRLVPNPAPAPPAAPEVAPVAPPRRRFEMPLLAKLVIALAAMGFLPLAISSYQLRENQDALLDQVQRTHIVAAKTTAARVDAVLQPLRALAAATAGNDAIGLDPAEPELQELLRSTLAARPELLSLGLYTREGDHLVLAQRREAKELLSEFSALREPAPLRLLRTPGQDGSSGRALLRLRQEVEGGRELVLWADVSAIDQIVLTGELGEEAQLVLATRELESLLGGPLAELPAEVLEQAKSGKVASSCKLYRQPGGEDQVVAYAQLREAPFFVVSRQPARVAEVAREKIKKATLRSAALALLLTLGLSAGAYFTVIQPLRRLATATRRLAGGGERARGSEISDLEASFALLQQRVKSRQEVGGLHLGRYQIVELLGSGAMGSVFRAWDEKLRRPVALKTIHLSSTEIDRDKLLGSLREEAAITARIHHGNIVTVYDIEEEGSSAFIAMELVEGVNLQSVIDDRGFLRPHDLLPIAVGIGRGLATAHGHGLVHHDIKPANILIGVAGEVKLTDFGVSQLITASSRAKDVICGTPGYLAPECFEGGTYGPEADLFAFGVVLYEAMIGRNPFRGSTLRETVGLTLSLHPDPPDRLDAAIPAELAQLVAELLEKEPADRPASAAIVVQRLEKIATGGGWTAPPTISDIRRRTMGRHSGAPTRLLTITSLGEVSPA
jgi:hypothetical protein